jgi:signal transduction histidine kinase
MVAIVSHDLKDPLSTIQMATSVLVDELVPDVAERRVERRHLQIIQRSAERMSRLIRDLLDANSARAGRLAVVRTPERVDALLADALDVLRPLADAKRIDLSAECPEGLPPVLADRERLLQVFANVGGNALKFTPAGGRVTIRVTAAGHAARFVVIDTGPGIPTEDLPRVFDRFWQAEGASGLGHGLGLAIAKAIVEAHGGCIGVTSTLGSGSAFAFTVPLAGVLPKA